MPTGPQLVGGKAPCQCSGSWWGWAHGIRNYRLQQDKKSEHWEHPAVLGWILELAPSPCLDGRGPLTQLGSSGKAAGKAGAAHADAQLANRLCHWLQLSPYKRHSLKNFLWDYFDGEGHGEKNRQLQNENLFTELKEELPVFNYWICSLI